MSQLFFPGDEERFATGRTALGLEAPDLVLRGGRYLNVFTKEILEGDIWVRGRFIARITADPCPFDTTIMDVRGKFIAPGFVEGHIHVESSLAEPRAFAEAALRCGVTSIFTDFHEVGAVAGRQGVLEMLEALRSTDVKTLFMTPMRLPFMPEIQHTLSTLSPVEALGLLQEDQTVGLAEVNGQDVVTSLKTGSANDLALFDHAVRGRRTPEGHLFFTRGAELDACLSVGLSSDHEPRKREEVAEKIRKGVFVMLRNGTLAREVETLVGVIPQEGLPADRVGLVTDDMLVSHMTAEGYMLRKVRLALAEGISVADALRMVSYNVAEHYRLGELIGALRPGAYADMVIFDAPETLTIRGVVASGKPVDLAPQTEKSGLQPEKKYSPRLLKTVLRAPITEADLRYLPGDYAGDTVTLRAIEMDQVNRFTRLTDVPLSVQGGDVDLSLSKDNLSYLICANRQRNELVGRAFLKDYGLREGGIAVSQAHDHHSIVALGRRKEDVILAANRVIELQGGVVLVQGGKVVAELPLPVAGLMSDLSAKDTAERIQDIEERLRAGGVAWYQPLFFLFWLGMEVAPFFRITDRGLFDTEKGLLIPCITEGNASA